jgi:aspartate/methionine/tyrosine aminotransferase
MSVSQTKETVIERLKNNELLQTPGLSPIRQSSQDLSVDQPATEPDSRVLEAAAVALEGGQTHYVDVPGIAPLREKIAEFLRDHFQVETSDAQRVIVTAGVQESRFLTIQMIGDLFQQIVLPAVVHPGARQAVGLRDVGAKFVPVDEQNGMLVSPDTIRSELEAGARLIYLESPSRLTGATYDAGTVRQIAEMIAEHDAAVIWDQGLAPWVEPDSYVSLASLPDMAERVAVLGELWPGAGLESWFVGFIGAKPEWIEPMRSQKQIMAICTSTASQFAALEAAELYADTSRDLRERLSSARQEAAERIGSNGLELLPGDAVSILAARVENAGEAARKLQEAGFKVAEGSAFGAPDVLRFAVGTEQTINDALGHLVQ